MADIILIVVGLLIIIVSFFLAEREDEEEETVAEPLTLSQEQLEASMDAMNDIISRRFDEKFAERWEETIADADDQMAQISNEKIMAVTDYSREVLEKIDQNHAEVVFLYKMLTEKEKEMKQLAAQIRKEKKDLEETYGSFLLDGGETEYKPEIDRSRGRSSVQKTKEASGQPSVVKEEPNEMEQRFEQKMENASRKKESPVKRQTEQLEENRKKQEKVVSMEREQTAAILGASQQNEQILMLYQEGKTIKEISKMLKKGQGEVKLVVDLYLNHLENL